ncbi:hypothetical protein [Kocuria nitroreducens]|uniref:hypothetical protein n=1 Tax=Kocuria nitroreducens TaxID=3058914 RepID=UPI0036DDC9B5
MPPLMPIEAFNAPSPLSPLLVVIGVAVAVVCVLILLRLYRPKHLDERTSADRGTIAGGSTAGLWGYGPGDPGGGVDGGGGQC